MAHYVKTHWVNDQTKLNADNLNHIEDGIEEISNGIEEISKIIPEEASEDNKVILEDKFNEELDKKLDIKTTEVATDTEFYLYSHQGETQNEVRATKNCDAGDGTIPIRYNGGRLAVEDPIEDVDATSKQYVDNKANSYFTDVDVPEEN